MGSEWIAAQFAADAGPEWMHLDSAPQRAWR